MIWRWREEKPYYLVVEKAFLHSLEAWERIRHGMQQFLHLCCAWNLMTDTLPSYNIHLFFPQHLLIEYLLCARNYSRCWKCDRRWMRPLVSQVKMWILRSSSLGLKTGVIISSYEMLGNGLTTQCLFHLPLPHIVVALIYLFIYLIPLEKCLRWKKHSINVSSGCCC